MVHINSSGDYAWRADLYDRVGEQLGENTKAGAIDGAYEFTEQMFSNLERPIDYSDMTEELAEILSMKLVQLESCSELFIEHRITHHLSRCE